MPWSWVQLPPVVPNKGVEMKLLIGSRALAHWNKGFKLKPNTDWDVISDEPIEGTEWHNSQFLNNYRFKDYTNNATVDFNGQCLHIVDMTGLGIIKRSHLWRKLSFQKHITHYHKYMQVYKEKNLEQQDKNILQERIELTAKAFPQGYPRLNKSVDSFFDDFVKKKYNHDYLHELVSYYDNPLYTKLQCSSASAWCDKDLWDKLSKDDKIKCIGEEVQVIAIERFLVPNDWNYSVRGAYIQSLDKVCTTLCSGWFRDDAINFYPEVLNLCDRIKFENIRKQLEKETQ